VHANRPLRDYAQILNVLEAVAEVAEKRVIEMLEHAALANDVADAFRPYDCDTASAFESLEDVGSVGATDFRPFLCT
jgi:hypothetical protein